jgi:hypothetical protein
MTVCWLAPMMSSALTPRPDHRGCDGRRLYRLVGAPEGSLIDRLADDLNARLSGWTAHYQERGSEHD